MAEFGIDDVAIWRALPPILFRAHLLAADMAFHRSQFKPGDLYVMTFDANQDKASVEYAYTSEWLTQGL